MKRIFLIVALAITINLSTVEAATREQQLEKEMIERKSFITSQPGTVIWSGDSGKITGTYPNQSGRIEIRRWDGEKIVTSFQEWMGDQQRTAILDANRFAWGCHNPDGGVYNYLNAKEKYLAYRELKKAHPRPESPLGGMSEADIARAKFVAQYGK